MFAAPFLLCKSSRLAVRRLSDAFFSRVFFLTKASSSGEKKMISVEQRQPQSLPGWRTTVDCKVTVFKLAYFLKTHWNKIGKRAAGMDILYVYTGDLIA